MKALITDLGNPKRTPEEIKESGRLFFNRGELNDDIALALVDKQRERYTCLHQIHRK